MHRGRASNTYGTALGRKGVYPPIPIQPSNGVSQERVDDLRAMWLDGTLVDYCDSVLDRLVDAMLLTREDIKRVA